MADPIELLEEQQRQQQQQGTGGESGDAEGGGTTQPEIVQIDRSTLEALQGAADSMREFGAALRAPITAPTTTPTVPNDDEYNDEFAVDPKKATQKVVQETVGPYARTIAAQLAANAITTFRTTKTTDRFYSQVVPFFTKRMETVDKVWLGSIKPEEQERVLNEAWLGAKGAYLDQVERTAPPAPTPPNLGGGAPGGGTSGGGGKKKKTLQELDPTTYAMAVRKGWTPERMQEFADNLQAQEIEE